MIDLCYVGNCSIDNIVIDNHIYQTIGGSSIYSSLSSRASTDSKIAIVGQTNKQIFQLLKEKKIDFYGKIVHKVTEFNINEDEQTCVGVYYNNDSFELSEELEINYLHVSFRKGVDIDSILNNKKIKYNHLSIDVMIHSILEFIPFIEKYKNNIEIIFCNMQEYCILKNYIEDIPLKVITHDNKPVVVINYNENKVYPVTNNQKILSSTGAGDSFIGGFLSKYIESSDIDISVNQGIYNSSKSIETVGPLIDESLYVDKINKGIAIPNNVIVIGNSCAGKTTFIDYLKKYFDIYDDIDDLEPLLETFMLDDLLYESQIEEFKSLKDKLKFIKTIWEEYNNNLNNIRHYTKKASIGTGHDIIRPILWDYIIEMAVGQCKRDNIIQFSRGKDSEYDKEFGENAYTRSMKSFINNLVLCNNTIIINIVSDLQIRKERNRIRYENGGHYVSDETMDNVYGSDIFEYQKIGNNFGYIVLDKEYPVYTIVNNKKLNSIELEKFLAYNLSEIIKYYNEFKEDKEHGFKTSTEKYLAK